MLALNRKHLSGEQRYEHTQTETCVCRVQKAERVTCDDVDEWSCETDAIASDQTAAQKARVSREMVSHASSRPTDGANVIPSKPVSAHLMLMT